ncbi:hypothetical protein RRG08_022060 [Elysia crispata]|uniref:Uncharacterized protein n=1 Tax=Elysia crispata TaxID=231223 RepID=A0AAE0Y1K7_9GAST|nr:hypothetical protein RRG08_022060 [Elysia crispata]
MENICCGTKGMSSRVLSLRRICKWTFQTKVSKKPDQTSRYLVEVKAITIQPDDLGLWKMSVVDGADKDERNRIFLSFRVYAQGPPQCPLEDLVHQAGKVCRSVVAVA